MADPGSRRSRNKAAAWQGDFLKLLAVGCSISDAAQAVGVDRAALYVARATDARFAAGWEKAVQTAAENLKGADPDRVDPGLALELLSTSPTPGRLRERVDDEPADRQEKGITLTELVRRANESADADVED